MINKYKETEPTIHNSVYIAQSAEVIGDVKIEEEASIWPKTVIRGDIAPVRIGKRVNVQDLSLIHQSNGLPVILEDGVSIGHQVTLHSCVI